MSLEVRHLIKNVLVSKINKNINREHSALFKILDIIWQNLWISPYMTVVLQENFMDDYVFNSVSTKLFYRRQHIHTYFKALGILIVSSMFKLI